MDKKQYEKEMEYKTYIPALLKAIHKEYVDDEINNDYIFICTQFDEQTQTHNYYVQFETLAPYHNYRWLYECTALLDAFEIELL